MYYYTSSLAVHTSRLHRTEHACDKFYIEIFIDVTEIMIKAVSFKEGNHGIPETFLQSREVKRLVSLLEDL